jgi:hypothetical protein
MPLLLEKKLSFLPVNVNPTPIHHVIGLQLLSYLLVMEAGLEKVANSAPPFLIILYTNLTLLGISKSPAACQSTFVIR